MPVIRLIPEGAEFEYVPGQTLLELLAGMGVCIESPCGGRCTCGKCKIRHKSGILPPLGKEEILFLSQDEQDSGIRLACCVVPRENISIELIQNDADNNALANGFVPEHIFEPMVYRKLCKIEKPSLLKQTPYAELLAGADQPVNLKTLQRMPVAESVCTAVYYDNDLLYAKPQNMEGSLYGLAVDIGTTTVVVSMVDLLTGEIIGSATCLNAQKSHGLDVLTRISFVLENPESGVTDLQKLIVDDINELVRSLCEENAIDSNRIYDITVAANPTMIHLLLGVSPASIGMSPYVPVFSSSLNLPAKEIGLLCADVCRLYCLPGVSAYIGSDAAAGAYVSGLVEEKGSALFIDIGTNGEIVLACKGELIACSCAAGPALEGMNISAGTRAAPGAIEDVRFELGSFKLKTIGGAEPNGICGSGIMAAVRELLDAGFIRKNGSLLKETDLNEDDCRRGHLWAEGRARGVMLRSGSAPISVTQNDIRQVQLAKAAILSGFCALLEIAELKMADLSRIVVAGQFGSHLTAESLVGVGLVPAELSDKIEYIGNSAHTGAYLALVSKPARTAMENLVPRISYKELSALPNYEQIFRKCIDF